MSRYRYDDEEDDGVEGYVPYALAAAGGAGGRIIGRKLGRKSKFKKAKGKGKSKGSAGGDERAANIGTGVGVAGGYGLGKAGTDPDSVRGTLESVLAARDAARGGYRWAADPEGNPLIHEGLRAAGLGVTGYGMYKLAKRARNTMKKGIKNEKQLKDSLKGLGKEAGVGAGGVGLLYASEAVRPTSQRRQREGVTEYLGNPFDPHYNRRR